MHSGSGRLAVKQKSAVSVYVGIAALVLEGRGLGYDDDEYVFLGVNQSQLHNIVVDGINADNAPSSSSPRHSVIERISEKLMRLRQFPGVSKDVIETSVAIPVNSRDEGDYERQPRLHHVASARELQRNPRVTAFPVSSTSNSFSSAASVLHDIDVDWNDISIVLNGLDSIINVPSSFPLKIPTNHSYRTSMSNGQEASAKHCKNKTSDKTSGGCSKNNLKPKQGPHCEKFLKKIGLLKLDTSEQDIDHLCNHVNNYVSKEKFCFMLKLENQYFFLQCRRWQFHLKKLLQLLSRGEDACIEVYLGPENNAILLEQWILKISDK
jgi:hypothetical protein